MKENEAFGNWFDFGDYYYGLHLHWHYVLSHSSRMKAYSTDLRDKIVLAYERGNGTWDQVAEIFGVGRRTVARFLKLHGAGHSLAPLPHGGGYPATLDEKSLKLLQSLVAAQPDATLAELSAHLNRKAKVEVHPSTLCRALQKLGLPRKKKPRRFGAGRRRPQGFPSQGRPTGLSPFRLHRRNWLSFGDDEGLWACGAWRESQPERTAQSRHRRDFDRKFGFARRARATESRRGGRYTLL